MAATQNHNVPETVLAPWHLQSKARTVARLPRVLAAVAAVGLVATLGTAFSPYRLDKARIVLVAPVPSADSGGPAADSNTARMALLARYIDAPFAEFQTVPEFVQVKSGVFSYSPAPLAAALQPDPTSQVPLIVYVTGILRNSSQGYLLCESSRLAQREHGLKISNLISQAAQSQSAASIICIEAWPDSSALDNRLAPGVALEKCREDIEAQLNDLPDQPLAVLITPATQYASPDRSTLLDALAHAVSQSSTSSPSCVSAHQLLEAISLGDENRATWQVTTAWNKCSLNINFPQIGRLRAKAPIADGDLQQVSAVSAEGGPTNGPDPSSNPLPMASAETFPKLANAAGSAQLLDYCWLVRERWLSHFNSPLTLPATRLDFKPTPFPSPEQAPVAWNQFDQFLVVAQQLLNRSPDSIELRSALLKATLALRAIDDHRLAQSAPLLDRSAPKWAHQLCQAYYTHQREAGLAGMSASGLTTNAASDADKRLAEMHLLTAATTSEQQARSIVDSWRNGAALQSNLITSSHVQEIKWAEHFVLDDRLPWNWRQSLLHNKLLSRRLLEMCGETVSAFPAMEVAEQMRLQSELAAVAPIGPQWHNDTTRLIADTTGQLKACQQYLFIRSRAAGVSRGLCRELPHWDQVLTPSEDRQLANDAFCQCVERLLELNRLLSCTDIKTAGELDRLTNELIDLRRGWLTAAESSGMRPTTIQIDLAQLLASGVPSLELRRAVAKSTVPARYKRSSNAQIWMRAKRQSALLNLVSALDTPMATSGLKPSLSQAVMNHLAQVEKLSESTSTTSTELLQALSNLEHSRELWLSQFAEDESTTSEARLHSPAALLLLASLEVGSQSLDYQMQQTAHAQSATSCQALAEHCLVQLEQASQAAVPLLLAELREWNQRLAQLGRSGLADPMEELTLIAPDTLDLSVRSRQQLPLRIINRTQQAQDVAIQVRFDRNLLDCQLSPLTEANDHRAERISNASLEQVAGCYQTTTIPPNSTVEWSLSVVSGAAAEAQTAIDMQLISDLGRRRHVVKSHLARPPLVSLRLHNQSGRLAESPSVYADELLGNRTSAVAIELTNQHMLPMPTTVKLWAAEQPLPNVPAGVLDAAAANAWLAEQPLRVLVDNAPRIQLTPRQAHTIKLPPLKLAPGAPVQLANQLLILVSAEELGLAQIFAWTPGTVRPSSYVRPSVSYHAPRNELRFQATIIDAANFPSDEVSLVAKLSEPDDVDDAATYTVQLDRNQPEGELIMRAPRRTGQSCLLRIDVDGWPNAFVYRVDTSRSLESVPIAGELQAIRVAESSGRQVLPHADTSVDVSVEAIISDGHFSAAREDVRVGLDIDRNRTLKNEQSLRLSSPVAGSITWNGCDSAGRILLQTSVRTPTLQIPLPVNWSGETAILASAQQLGRSLWSMSQPLIIDRNPPRVLAATAVGSKPPLLGKPVEIRVRTDDGDLSQVATIEGAWSLTGAADFAKDVPPVPGVKLQDGSWSLILPTDTIRSGATLLLVRAVDMAGNVSPTHRTFIEVLDEAAMLAKQKSITTTLRGRVLFGNQPQEGIELVLSTAEPAALHSRSRTDARGEFSFTSVSSGTYQVELSGLVRGMRVKRKQTVVVDAPNPPEPTVFRLDRPEAKDSEVSP